MVQKGASGELCWEASHGELFQIMVPLASTLVFSFLITKVTQTGPTNSAQPHNMKKNSCTASERR